MEFEAETINSNREDESTSASVKASMQERAKHEVASGSNPSLAALFVRSILVGLLFFVALTVLLPIIKSAGCPNLLAAIFSCSLPGLLSILLFTGLSNKQSLAFFFAGLGIALILIGPISQLNPLVRYALPTLLGVPSAQTELAQIYLNQNKDADTTKRAVPLLESAAAKGDSRAMIQLGILYLNGREGLPQNIELAIEWLKQPANDGDALALARLGQCYLTGTEHYNPTEAERLLKLAVAEQNPQGCYYLGSLYEKGAEGVAKNEREAVRLYEKAGDYPSAMRALSLCKLNGTGTTKETIEAVSLMKKAGEGGDPAALCYLGLWYLNGENGFVLDEKEAVHYFEMSAEKGFASAHRNLGYCYENGLGVSRDIQKAFDEYDEGSSGNDSYSQKAAAKLLMEGSLNESGRAEFERAIPYLKPSAEKGDAEAMFNLARCLLEQDNESEESLDQGKRWMEKAAKAGSEQAKQYLEANSLEQ